MVRKNKIEASPHFNEIVNLLLSGFSGRYVSDYLDDHYDESISHVSLNKYKKNNLNVKAGVRKKIMEREKQKKIKEKQEQSAKLTKSQRDKVTSEIAEQEINKQESYNDVVDFNVKNFDKIQNLVELSDKIDLSDALETYKNSKDFDPEKYIELIIKIKKLGLDANKQIMDMFDDNELNVNVHNLSDLFDEDEMRGIIEDREKHS
ncbi:hypothetical protein [Methanobrevibacter boviskoreani]|uniref:hypothetical protein n=1 Tax=Methanobrevibacter boviskoreani TaxID=1348249 RepID=UPI000594F299|nr:hypothetical protein [Methanobrevibacter boviskoreani]